MNPYYVISPEFETPGSSGGWEMPEPPEYGCDCVEVEARTRREALRIGVKRLLSEHPDGKSWASVNKMDNLCPYSGYKVELARCGHGNPHFIMVGNRPVHLRCWGCEMLQGFDDSEDAA
jgi:hypothetical protein